MKERKIKTLKDFPHIPTVQEVTIKWVPEEEGYRLFIVPEAINSLHIKTVLIQALQWLNNEAIEYQKKVEEEDDKNKEEA